MFINDIITAQSSTFSTPFSPHSSTRHSFSFYRRSTVSPLAFVLPEHSPRLTTRDPCSRSIRSRPRRHSDAEQTPERKDMISLIGVTANDAYASSLRISHRMDSLSPAAYSIHQNSRRQRSRTRPALTPTIAVHSIGNFSYVKVVVPCLPFQRQIVLEKTEPQYGTLESLAPTLFPPGMPVIPACHMTPTITNKQTHSIRLLTIFSRRTAPA